MITVWLVWEFAERPQDLRDLLRAYVAGSWVLAVLTIGNFGSPAVEGQIRFMPEGQDPNDVARFLNLGFPMAALLFEGEPGWAGKLLAFGYLPLGFAGVLLTASRSGFVAALVALAGCGLIMARKHLAAWRRERSPCQSSPARCFCWRRGRRSNALPRFLNSFRAAI